MASAVAVVAIAAAVAVAIAAEAVAAVAMAAAAPVHTAVEVAEAHTPLEALAPTVDTNLFLKFKGPPANQDGPFAFLHQLRANHS